MLNATDISENWGKRPPRDPSLDKPRVIIGTDTYESILLDIKLLKDVPIAAQYVKEGGPTTRDKLLFIFVTKDLWRDGDLEDFAEMVTFQNLTWGQKAGLPKFLKALDRKGFTEEVAQKCAKDRTFFTEYLNGLIGKDYEVESEPSKDRKRNYAVSAKLSKTQTNTPHPKTLTGSSEKDDSTGLESLPDTNEDDLPF